MKESNTLLITDYPKNIETIKKVIKDINSDNLAIVKVIPIKYAEVKKLQTRLVDISKSLFNEKVSSQKVKIILDDNINGIIIVGNEANVAKVEELIKRLDIESNASKSVQIFSLKNSDAKAVLASLTDIISKQVFADPAMKPNVSASEEINAIIAIGESIILKGIKHIIDELDREKYQVYVQAKIIEISKNDVEKLGIKYGFDGGGIADGGLYTLSGNFGGVSVSIPESILSNIDLNGVNFALGATLDFLEVNGASKAVSNPSILCVNNQESSIYVGKTIYVKSGTTSNSVSGITDNYKPDEIGLTLKLKPRVSSKDKVTLKAETILENIIGVSESGHPISTKQEIKTEAILRHGESIVIGGLVKTYDKEDETKIPFLGDIPWIGKWLFSSTSLEKQEDNLLVILTPYIIDKSEKLSQLQKELGILADLQREYNVEVFKRVEKQGLKEDVDLEEKTDVLQIESLEDSE